MLDFYSSQSFNSIYYKELNSLFLFDCYLTGVHMTDIELKEFDPESYSRKNKKYIPYWA